MRYVFIILGLLVETLHAQTSISNGGTLRSGAALVSGSSCQITTSILPPASLNVFYDITLQTTNCQSPLIFSVSSGTFPNWATLNQATGRIFGTPNTAGSSIFTIKVVDSSGQQSFLSSGFDIAASSGGIAALPDPALLNFDASRAGTPTSNISICVGTPVNAAALPGGSCNTSYAATAAGLTSALAAAACGQVINITPGAFGAGATSPYAGAFSWPNINCPITNWLWITRDLSDPVWPAEGVRVDPSYMGIPQNQMRYEPYPLANGTPNTAVRHMPQFICNQTSGNSCWGWPATTKTTKAGNHIRFIGIEFTRDDSFDSALALFDFDFQPLSNPNDGTGDCDLVGSTNNALPVHADRCQADQPGFVILDQCILNGSAQRQTVIGLKIAGATWVILKDSYAYDFGVTFAGGNGDGHFYGGGTGHGYTGVGHWLFENTFSESSTMSNEFCGAFDEPRSPLTGGDGVPTDVAWQYDYFWKKPTWDPQLGQAHNASETIEGQVYGPTPPQELDVTPTAIQLQQGSQFQLQTLLLWDTSSGINRILQHLGGVGSAPFAATVDGVNMGNSTTGIMTVASANVGSGAWVSQNQIKWTYNACSGVGTPIAACTAATTPGAHVVLFTALTNSNVLATQGQTLTLTASSTITVTASAPVNQIALSPNSPTLSIQPSYSDNYFNIRRFCYTMFAFPNFTSVSMTWKVDGVTNGNASVGQMFSMASSSYISPGTNDQNAAYCSGTALGNHTISVTSAGGTVGTSVINVSTNAVIYGYDLKAYNSKNGWELKCGERVLTENILMQVTYAGAGNGGGQPGNWFLTQVGNQSNQTLDGSGVDVGYGPQHINDITIRNFHAIHMGSGAVIAALNSALGVHRVAVSNSLCEDCDYTKWMNGFQKVSQVLQLSGSASSTKRLNWTSPATPLADNISFTKVTFLGPVTSLVALANNNFQFQLGPLTWKDNLMSSTGSSTFHNNNGDINDCNGGNTEPLAFQGTAYSPAKPCFSAYTFTPNVLVDSTAPSTNFTSPNIFQPTAASVGFVNYNSGNAGDYRLCTGLHTPSIRCPSASLFSAGQLGQDSNGGDQGADVASIYASDNIVRWGTSSPMQITTTTLPDATHGVAYSQTLAVTGGTSPYSWTTNADIIPIGAQDILDYACGSFRNTQHLTGATVKYCVINADLMMWVKGSGGSPADGEMFDSNYVYQWFTEGPTFSNPSGYKKYVNPVPLWSRYHIPGKDDVVLTPGPNKYDTTESCGTDHLAQIDNLDIKGELTGPFTDINFQTDCIAAGGSTGTCNVPNGTPYLLAQKFIKGTAGVYQIRERYKLALGFGQIIWDTSHLSGGSFVIDQTSTNETVVSGGNPTPNFACGIPNIPVVNGLPNGTISTSTPSMNLSNSGTLSGTPTAAGTYNFIVQVEDAAGRTAHQNLSIIVH